MALAILIFSVVFAVVLIVRIVSHRHKVARSSSHLIGASGLVSSVLSPEGAVLIDGELWRARSIDYSPIPATANVRVVDIEEHLLLVKRNP